LFDGKTERRQDSTLDGHPSMNALISAPGSPDSERKQGDRQH
jgi:hypothetical protein